MAYNHDIQHIERGHYRLSWTIDRKYTTSRLRFPTGFSRDTDYAGARRFAKKWHLPEPIVEAEDGRLSSEKRQPETK
jgi:hypothetical protein